MKIETTYLSVTFPAGAILKTNGYNVFDTSSLASIEASTAPTWEYVHPNYISRIRRVKLSDWRP